jgi:putative ABC transport system permease protein
MIDFLSILSSLMKVVFKRIRHNLGLSISALIGIIAIMSIIVAVPVFSHAVSSEVLKNQLAEKALTSQRRLFSIHYYNIDDTSTMNSPKVDTVNQYIRERFPELLNLQVEDIIQEIQTTSFSWNSLQDIANIPQNTSWMDMAFFTLDGLQDNARLIEGAWPQHNSDLLAPVQVAVLAKTADNFFLSVGDRFQYGEIQIEISGLWEPTDPQSTWWFDRPDTAYANRLFIPNQTFRERLEPALTKPVFYSSWYIITDESQLNYTQSETYARGMVRLDTELRQLLPGITADYSPLDALQGYLERSAALTTLIFAVSGPMVIMALLFIGLTATISIQQYEQEIATMRGRGTSWGQVSGLNLIESLLLIFIAIPVSILMGWLAANLIGKTLSFLSFTDRASLSYTTGAISILWIILGALLVIGARFFPMFSLSRTTIIQVKQEQSRSLRKPFWQRFYLDFLLLIPGIYAFISLRGLTEGAKFIPRLNLSGGDAYRDPLLFVAPSLFSIGLCMISLRVLPFLMRIFARLVDKLPGVWAYLSIQQISRRPQDHSNALLLIMISLGLSIFSASTAKTLDQWLYDQTFYRSGADLAVHEYVVIGEDTTGFGSNPGSGRATISELDLNVEGYVSVEDHLKLPSIEAATRVGKYEGSFSYGLGERPAFFMGIDRLDFPSVAFYREDFASVSLGSLMNSLATDPNSVLIPRWLAEEVGLQIGDRINVSVNILNVNNDSEMIITGLFDYFPTVYPSERPTFITNLDSIFENPDAVIGYDLWFKLRQATDIQVLLFQLRQLMGVPRAVVRITGDGYPAFQQSLEQPERIGVFGVLNVGFIVTGLMPGIGFVLYSYASLRRRFIQLGILQAIGMSVKQLIGYLSLEQFLLMGLAILSGALIGIATSYIFVPLLQYGATSGVPVPPFEVAIGWAEAIGLTLAFGLVLVLTILGTIIYLARIKVFQAVKMGESL